MCKRFVNLCLLSLTILTDFINLMNNAQCVKKLRLTLPFGKNSGRNNAVWWFYARKWHPKFRRALSVNIAYWNLLFNQPVHLSSCFIYSSKLRWYTIYWSIYHWSEVSQCSAKAFTKARSTTTAKIKNNLPVFYWLFFISLAAVFLHNRSQKSEASPSL